MEAVELEDEIWIDDGCPDPLRSILRADEYCLVTRFTVRVIVVSQISNAAAVFRFRLCGSSLNSSVLGVVRAPKTKSRREARGVGASSLNPPPTIRADLLMIITKASTKRPE